MLNNSTCSSRCESMEACMSSIPSLPSPTTSVGAVAREIERSNGGKSEAPLLPKRESEELKIPNVSNGICDADDVKSKRRKGARSKGSSYKGYLSLPLQLSVDREKNAVTQTRKKHFANYENIASKIRTDLFVSGQLPSKNKELLISLGITHIVNCARKTSADRFQDAIEYLDLYIDDTPGTNIDFLLYEVLDFYLKARASGGRVLVHCQSGVSRSCSFAIGILMATDKKVSFKEAFKAVVQIRPICNPNAGFCSQLLDFSKRFRVNSTALSTASTTATDTISDSTDMARGRIASPRLYSITALGKRSGRPIGRLRSRRRSDLAKSPTALERRHLYFLIDSGRMRAFVWVGSECAASPPYQSRVISALMSIARRIVRLERGAPKKTDETREKDEIAPSMTEGAKVATKMCDRSPISFERLAEGHETSLFLQILGEVGYKLPCDDLVVSVADCRTKPRRTTPRGYLESPRPSIAGSSVSGGGPIEGKPMLYQWLSEERAWDRLGDYETDDLQTTGLYILRGTDGHNFVWIGQEFSGRANKHEIAGTFSLEGDDPKKIVFVDESSETDAFWDMFEEGF